jgi:hypothetical protein
MTGLNIAVSDDEWAPFASASTEQLAGYLLILANNVDLRKVLKTTRKPKKPPIPRTKFKGKTHVSTAKLLAGSGLDTE